MARELFALIRDRHGTDEAFRIFAMFRPTSRRDHRELSNLSLLWRYDMMKPKNKARLARIVAEENKALPKAERRTGAHSTSAANLRKHIDEIINRRAKAIKAGTWPWPSYTEDRIFHT
jgi:hypothetical protein